MLLTLLDRIHYITRTTHIARVLTSGVPHKSSYYPHYSTFLILLQKCLILLELFTSFVPTLGECFRKEHHVIAHTIHITPHLSHYTKEHLILLVLFATFVSWRRVECFRKEHRITAHIIHINPHYFTLLTILERTPHITRPTHIIRALTSRVPHNSSYYPHYFTLLISLEKIPHFTHTTHITRALRSRGAAQNSAYCTHYSLLFTLLERIRSHFVHYSYYSCSQVWRSASARWHAEFVTLSKLLHITHVIQQNLS